jgi:hypothetical protein
MLAPTAFASATEPLAPSIIAVPIALCDSGALAKPGITAFPLRP